MTPEAMKEVGTSFYAGLVFRTARRRRSIPWFLLREDPLYRRLIYYLACLAGRLLPPKP